MIKILIVDDKEFIRNEIELNIERLVSDAQVVGKAEDAEQAMEIVKEFHPHIVITDIQMPETDGLKLIENIRGLYDDIRFIAISNYQNFDYVKKAITLGVEDYLLKPLENEELVDVIDKIRKKINSELIQKKYFLDLKTSERSNLEFIRNKCLADVIENSGEFDIAEVLNPLKHIDISFKSPYFTVITVLIGNLCKIPSSVIEELPILKFAIVNVCDEILGVLGNSVTFENLKKENQIVTIINHEKSNGLRITQVCKELLAAFHKYLDLNATIGIGNSYSSLKEVNKSYTESYTAAMQKIVIGSNRAIHISEVPNSSLVTYFLSENEKLLLSSYIKSQNLQKSFGFIDNAFSTVKLKELSYLNIKALCIDLLILVGKIVKEYGENWGNIFHTDIFSETFFSSFNTLDELKDWVKDCIKSICGYISYIRKSDGKKAISEIKDYIGNNYFTDINLNKMSDRYFINSSYLSQLFKSETGQKFVDYITGVRMEKAKELLSSTPLKSYEIAEMVGYSDSRYFSNVFSKYVGTTPAKYRDQSSSFSSTD